jgi:hypothetical protein
VRILYRVRQFWQAITAKTDPGELEKVLEFLSPEQAALFRQLQTGEKNHSMKMARKLIEQGDKDPNLLAAALLHDVGKLRYRLNPFERSLIVMVRACMPGMAQKWGQQPTQAWDSAPGWRKPFVLAEQHARWGAEMALRAGASELTAALILNHHSRHGNNLSDLEKDFQGKLWKVDNEY